MCLEKYMRLVDEYLWIMIAMGASFLLSLFVLFNAKRKWLGCILQFFTFIVLFIISGLLFGMCRGWVDSSNESEAMVGIRLIEEDRDCRFETTWWMKPDNTYYYKFDKGSNHHQVEPCGNDSYSGKGSFTRIDSLYAIKANINPSFVIFFNLDSQSITPIYNSDTLEVIKVNWELIKEYFKLDKIESIN
jgi:hypothetical protein